jgi:hypothetical protein
MLLLEVALLLVLAVTVLTQPSPPMPGVQLGTPELGIDFRFPSTVSQCEPVLIYYNITNPGGRNTVWFSTLDNNYLLYISPFPLGAGFFEWICNIPAGYGFAVFNDKVYFVVVQQGTSSSCLGNITTTHAYASYTLPIFETYTAQPPNTTLYAQPAQPAT